MREMEHRKAFSMVLDLAYSLCIALVFRAFPIHVDCTLYTHTAFSRAYALDLTGLEILYARIQSSVSLCVHIFSYLESMYPAFRQNVEN